MRTLMVIVAFFSATIVAQSGCQDGIQRILAPLSSYNPAQEFCSEKFARTITITSTVASVQPEIFERDVFSSGAHIKRRHPSSPELLEPRPRLSRRAGDNEADALLSLGLAQAAKVVSTLCSCIAPPATITVREISRALIPSFLSLS